MKEPPVCGRQDAHQLVEQLSKEAQERNVHLKDLVLLEDTITKHLSNTQIETLFNPEMSVGFCKDFIDHVLSGRLMQQ